jgi:hypothetical protein
MARNGTKEFGDEVCACVEQITAFLPELADRHSPLVVLAALSEHLGGALYLCQEAGACTPLEARAVLRELKELTFASEGPTGTARPGPAEPNAT